MTGWDVASDFVKIVLPAAITAVTAYLIAARTRQHDFDRERRRRHREAIEEIAIHFNEVCDSTEKYLPQLRRIEDRDARREAYLVFRDELNGLRPEIERMTARLELYGYRDAVFSFAAWELQLAGGLESMSLH